MTSAAATTTSGIKNDITQCIGNTPLVQLRRVTDGCVATVAAKLENLNPLWSVKDRIGRLDDRRRRARRQDQARHGDHRAHQRQHGHRPGLRLRGPRLQADGDDAREHEPRAAAAAQGPGRRAGAHARGRRHARRRPQGRGAGRRSNTNYFMPQQFKNPANPEIHRKTTAEEIWRDTDGKVDIFVRGVGTGGTITGVGEVIKKPQAGRQDDRRRAGQQPGHHADARPASRSSRAGTRSRASAPASSPTC